MTNKPRKRARGGGRKPKGPIAGNDSWLQARIPGDLRSKLDEAAAANGRSLSQEANFRLKRSFSLLAKLEKAWGPPEAQALAYLVSRLVRSIHVEVGGSPFVNAGALGWRNNPFTHAALQAAISTLLDRLKPDGPIEAPAGLMGGLNTPEAIGNAHAIGLLSAVMTTAPPPTNKEPGAHYSANRLILPEIRGIIGDDDD